MLLRLWSDQPYRATRDLDLLRRGDGAADVIRDDLRAIVATAVPPDAVTFDGDQIGLEPIRAVDARGRRPSSVVARPSRAEDPIGLTPLHWQNPSRPAQVRAFPRRARLDVPAKPEEVFLRLLQEFLLPLLEDLRSNRHPAGTWPPGGPWR